MKDMNDLLNAYADLLLRFGVAFHKGQKLVVEIPACQAELAEILQEQAYRLGAGSVHIFLSDERKDADMLMQTPIQAKEKILKRKQRLEEALEGDSVSLAFLSPTPLLNQGLPDSVAIQYAEYKNDLRNVVRRAIRGRGIQWCYACVPNPDWAVSLFPGWSEETAMKKLWDVLADIMLLKEADPLAAWLEKYDQLYQHTAYLNQLELTEIHFSNGLGTDLTVGLNPDCIWEGGVSKESYTPDYYQCNFPSYEICTTTNRLKTNGHVVASRPLCVSGSLIKDFSFDFKDGAVVGFEAGEGRELIENLLAMDEGSRYIGEVAFVESTSPIFQTGMTFYNTLLDENAACHLALGEGFPGNIRGIDPHDKKAVADSGVNRSIQHTDFMFGTSDLCAEGVTRDGRKVPLFLKGEFLFGNMLKKRKCSKPAKSQA